jgi:hypothetical protein
MSTQSLVFMKQLLDNVEYADEQGVLNVIKLFNHQDRELTEGTSYALGAYNVIHKLIERRPELFTPKIIQELALLAEGNEERVEGQKRSGGKSS